MSPSLPSMMVSCGSATATALLFELVQYVSLADDCFLRKMHDDGWNFHSTWVSSSFDVVRRLIATVNVCIFHVVLFIN